MPTNKDLGQAIRRLRRDRHLTIEALAFAADMHPTYLSGIERGVRNPTWDRITALAGALGVTIVVLAEVAAVEAELAHAMRETRERLAPEASVHE